MPRAARFKIAAVKDLMRQIEYAPDETRRRQMDAAERLVHDIDPAHNYPQEFIVYRVTGYRSDAVEEPVTFVGEALLPDLVNLVQLLSNDLNLPMDYRKRNALTIEEAAARLQVSLKTIQRYRQQGLVCHVIDFGNRRRKLGCFEDSLQQFIDRHQRQVRQAGKFTRINGELEAEIIAQARELKQTRQCSLHEAAGHLAQKHGRAHETVRGILRRHERTAAEPIFRERGPLTERDIRLIYRAWIRGIDPARLAEHFGKTKPTIHRAINRRRRELLRDLQITFIALPTFELPDAASVILSAPAAVTGLTEPASADDALRLLAVAHRAEPVDEAIEDALVAAFNFLKMRSVRQIATLDDAPSSQSLDAIETDLRWAAMLKRRLVRLGLPAAIRRLEQNLHRSLADQPADEIAALLRIAVNVIRAEVDSLDPSRGQRLERMTAFAMDRVLAKRPAPQTAARAAAKHAGAIPVPGLLDGLAGWEKALDPWRWRRENVEALTEPERQILTRRYGWGDQPPQTARTAATQLGMKPVGVARRMQQAIRALRAVGRT